jgi:endonuclease III
VFDLSLRRVVEQLHAVYGEPESPPSTDPLELILWENVAYLVDDARRATALDRLRRTVGTRPEQILAAPIDRLVDVARVGMLPEQRADKLRRIAELTLDDFGGDLDAVRRMPLAAAKRALQKFPGIGEPGAEKILLFARIQPVLALDSNGLRVLVRLGFAAEASTYAGTYRAVREAVAGQLPSGNPPDYAWLIAAHQLLRRHGQELCRRARPLCAVCPLREECRYDQRAGGSPGSATRLRATSAND